MTAIALLACSCGIPMSSQPNVVSGRNVPFHLLSPTVPTSTTTSQPTVAYVPESIYLLNGAGNAVVVRRDVPVPATLSAVLSALLDGPSSPEASSGIITVLPQDGKILSTSIQATVATVNLNTAFSQVSGASEVKAVGQLVLTATAQPGVSAVIFEILGVPISVPIASGAVTALPVTAAQYKALLG
jgi:spore germination protein GerM